VRRTPGPLISGEVCSRHLWELGSKTRAHAPEEVGEQFCAATNAKAPVERLYVVVGRLATHVKTRGRLLFAVPFEQARESLPLPPGEVKRIRVEDTDQSGANEPAQLAVKEADESSLPI
jgi:hypothetical protein